MPIAPTIEVGEGPTGIALHEAAGRAYVLNKFEASVSVVDLVSEVELARVAFHDASPPAIRLGRRHMYATHETSGLGQASCASCHIDSRFDKLAWDLGNPAGGMKGLDGQNLGGNAPSLIVTEFVDWHPMKGPMLTQTLQDIIGKEPLHWRGDRAGIEEFNPAFQAVLGDDEQLTDQEMQELEDFLATIHFPPNPFRALDNSLPDSLPLPQHKTTGHFGPAELPLPHGDAQRGMALMMPPNFLEKGTTNCTLCHTFPTGLGTDFAMNSANIWEQLQQGPHGERHHALIGKVTTNATLKIPQLRNLYERVGLDFQGTSRQGFGYTHDGAVDQLESFVTNELFEPTSDQDVADMVAFLLAFSAVAGDAPQTQALVLRTGNDADLGSLLGVIRHRVRFRRRLGRDGAEHGAAQKRRRSVRAERQ